MNKEKGITLASLVVTIVLMSVLAAIMINATLGSNALKEEKELENEYKDLMENTEGQIQSVDDQWKDVMEETHF